MLTKNEITALNLSPTKKDFVQIWNELLEVAGKLSERWDPASTNESDPGIVILKALTGIADKLNYNIDKNTLEAFMPTAAQEDSMRKLCEMLGYNIKYYQSATTKITIKYHNPDPTEEEASAMLSGLYIPKFTVITNADRDISYFTINNDDYRITANSTALTLECMEGQLVRCDSINDNYVIYASQISETNRFYLPETQIAENGIFVYNVEYSSPNSSTTNLMDGEPWQKVDNLNTQKRGAKVFKFGFDSYESRPYIEFPEDYSELFNEGIFVYYARTNGINGNISAHTLTQIELPSTIGWSNVQAESFVIDNAFAATSGTNIETITQAYNNFKKTIGTFDVLVTCRDYMNKIYSLIDTNGRPYVSNVLATDIRNDLNRAITICSCDNAGIYYKETPLYEPVTSTAIRADNGETVEIKQNKPLINHFDLVLYPFKSYNQIRSYGKDISKIYNNSFEFNGTKFNDIKNIIDNSDFKNIAHTIIPPRKGDTLSINNYLRLNATIATNAKVSSEECTLIIENVKVALANAFNLRELDFGEEIPFDSIIEVIEKADSRIKVASLNDPALYTTFSVLENASITNPKVIEYAVQSNWLDVADAQALNKFTHIDEKKNEVYSSFNTTKAKEIYNKLVLRNILAGRVSLFNYNNVFTSNFSEAAYQETVMLDNNSLPMTPIIPSAENPYTVWVENTTNVINALDSSTSDSSENIEVNSYNSSYTLYTGRYVDENTPPIYTATATPEDLAVTLTENTISTDAKGNNITDIKSYCDIYANEDGVISNVPLSKGEFVKFRAPNFTTKKTYPAYVNYHLALNTDTSDTSGEARAAKANTLFNILNTPTRWQKVLDYFSALDRLNDSEYKYKKKYKLSQKVSKFSPTIATTADVCDISESGYHELDETTHTCKHCGVELLDSTNIGALKLNIGGSTTAQEYTLEELFTSSGCFKLLDTKPSLAWDTSDGDDLPTSEAPLETIRDLLSIDIQSPFITRITDLTTLQTEINNTIIAYRESMPQNCAWTVDFEFECVPFNAASFDAWAEFISSSATDRELLDFRPVVETETVFWRVYGEGYDIGQYILNDSRKLLKFNKKYFSLLEGDTLRNIYLVEDLGKDAIPALIKNNEEYELKVGEYLYIEYTPSATSEDGTSQDVSPKTEVYEAGTIIRPSGFESGLMDSSVYFKTTGNSPAKVVTFKTNTMNTQVAMQRFSANEQVEVRDFAKVELSKETFKDTQVKSIYIYKNFNGCDALESIRDPNTNDIITTPRKYTLKDGEYIFYTDQNKSELAYFTNGTEVTLTGNIVIPTFNDLIDIGTILESSIEDIPWKYLPLTGEATIDFQEYQYITLGADDIVDSLVLLNSQVLNDTWTFCDFATYKLSNNDDIITELPAVNISGRDGCGWEVSSSFEISSSPIEAQTLRSIPGVIETGLTLGSVSSGGSGASSLNVSSSNTDSQDLLFKTNLACIANNNHINIDDVYYNPNKLSSFEFKFFTESAPVIVQTKPNKVAPYGQEAINMWTGEPIAIKDSAEVWNQISLEKLKINQKNDDESFYDNALRLSVCLIPKTYGIASFYVEYAAEHTGAETWIEVYPGTSHEDFSIINTVEDPKTLWQTAEEGTNNADRLYLKPGINCVRFNKTCQFFIKTSEESQGSLFFDDLKLVNCEALEYYDYAASDASNTSPHTVLTNGLNLKQLNYLFTEEADVTTIDKTTYDQVKNSLCNDYTNELNVKLSESKAKTAKLSEPLIKALPTVESLLKDLEAFAKNSSEWSSLASTYAAIKKSLDAENSLLETLNNNAIEENLLALISQFADRETAEQQFLNELVKIKNSISININESSKEALLKSFEEIITDTSFNTAFRSDIASVINETKGLVLQTIKTDYSNKLTTLVAELEQTVNNKDRNKISEVLEVLLASNRTANYNYIQLLISQLHNIAGIETINALVLDILKAANAEDYSGLVISATQLKNIFEANEIKYLLDELTKALEAEDTDTNLVTLSTQLSNYVTSIQNNANEVIKAIDKLILSASGSSPTASTVQSNATSVQSKINDNYKTGLGKNVASLKSDIENYTANSKTEEAIKELITLLKDEGTAEEPSANAEVSRIATEIKALFNSNKDNIKDINGLEVTTGSSADALKTLWTDTIQKASYVDLFNNTVADVWPLYFKKLIFKKFATLEASIINCILTPVIATKSTNNLGLTYVANTDAISTVSTDFGKYSAGVPSKLKTYLALDSISTLIRAVKTRCFTEQKQRELTSIIDTIVDTVGLRAKITETVQDSFKENKTALIANLLTEFKEQGKDISAQRRKANLLNDLKEELNNVKTLDEQLLANIQDYLLPNVAKVQDDFDEDSYEYFLASKAEEIIINSSNVGFDTLSTALNYLSSNKLDDFCITYSSNKTALASLVTDTIETNISTLIVENTIQQELQTIVEKVKTINTYTINQDLIDELTKDLETADLKGSLTILLNNLMRLETQTIIIAGDSSSGTAALSVLQLENKLLADIVAIDTEKAFYYTMPLEASLAIEFGNDANSCLMNPAINYDINNINNNFVVSKLDIDYLDTGLQIAKSSRLN